MNNTSINAKYNNSANVALTVGNNSYYEKQIKNISSLADNNIRDCNSDADKYDLE